MKKLNTISMILIAFFAVNITLLSAADLIITKADTTLAGGVDDLIQIKAVVKNNNMLNSVPTKLKLTIEEIQEGQSLLICWGVTCYSPTYELGERVFPDIIDIPANGDSGNDFKCDIEQGGVTGPMRITFTFYNADNPSDEVSFTADVMIGPVSVEDFKQTDFSIYPNPSMDYVNLILDGSDNIKSLNITNIYGIMVKSMDVNKAFSLVTISVKELPSGVYFLSTISNKGILNTKRFEISR